MVPLRAPSETQSWARLWPWLILGVFGLHAGLRLVVSPALEMDEAEQALFAQDLALGYDEQPPLYTWLVWLFSPLLGPLGALVAVKTGLLVALHAAAFGTAAHLAGRPAGVLASAALFLVPSIAWEMQRDLTHSVLGLTGFALFLWAMTAAAGGRAVLAIGLAGAVAALGKYNYGLAVLAGYGVWLAVPALRRRIGVARLLAALALTLALVAPAGIWHLVHPATALQDTGALGVGQAGVLAGAASAVLGMASLLALPALLAVLLWWRPTPPASTPTSAPPAPGALHGFLWLALVLVVAVGLAVALAGVTSLRERWLLPVAYPVLLAGAITLARRSVSMTVPAAAAGAAVLAVFAGMIVTGLFGPALDRPNRLHFPLDAAMAALDSLPCAGAPVLAGDDYLAGNLAAALAQPVASLGYRCPLPPAAPLLLAVWRDGHAIPGITAEMRWALPLLRGRAGQTTSIHAACLATDALPQD